MHVMAGGASTDRAGTSRGTGSGAALTHADPELVERFFELLSAIYRHLRFGPLDVWEELEITRAQLRTLVFLSEGPARMTTIAGHLGTSLPAATGLIDRLVAKGLVERGRDPADRRAVVCSLTPSGWDVLARFEDVGREEFEHVVRRLDPAELRSVVDAVEILATAVEQFAGSEAPAAR